MKCTNCHHIVMVFRIRRSFIERHITKRKRTKYQCGSCHATFFI